MRSKAVPSILCVIAFLFAVSPDVVRAQANSHADKSHKITVMDEFQIQLPTDPQISPDGSKIVYVRHFSDPMTDKRYANLWIINSDGTGHRALTTGNRSDASPRWSPDGTRIAYLSDADGGKQQIYVRWMDTGQTARITNLEESPDAIAWSPDGTMLSFSALVVGKGPHIADLPSPPEGAKWADPPKAYDRLVYRFNGTGYLKPGYQQVFVVSADGGAPRQITTGDSPNGGNEFGPTRASWSADGKYLIISANRHPESDHAYFDTNVYEFDADGKVRQLTSRNGPDNNATVSPDGKWIAYTGYDDRYQGHQTTQLYVMNRDGSGQHSITEKLDRDAATPQWADDNSGVYFQYDDQGDTKIGFASVDGNFKKIADHVASTVSTYGGGSFSVSRTGTIAFTSGNGNNPGDIAVAGNGGIRVITAVNRELLTQKAPGHVEELWFNSSKDNRKIEGWIVHPPDFDSSKKYPLMLEIHGGPFADYGDRFDLEKQVWASMGYVVVYVNPRGSTSYGEEFANLIHHAYPGDDFDDLNSGVDAVVARGYIDTNNEFVTGGSGGGVLTCWTIEHTNRFRAAASLYPVINWYSFVLTSDIPWTAKYWFPGNPWDNTEQYMKRSLTDEVAKVKTPTLVMTGEQDFRTPISEAEQFYSALKLLNVEAVLVRVPGEPHGISRLPSHHIDKMLLVGGWFDQHKSK